MNGRYRTIVADPPWPISAFPKWADGSGVTPTPYPTMSLDEIRALPVGTLADGFAHLYLWTINDYLVESFDIARAWGFEPSATLVWCKPPRGVRMGGLFASNVEFVLFCRASTVTAVYGVTKALANARDRIPLTNRQIDEHFGLNGMASHWTSARSQPAIPTWDQYRELKTLLCLDDSLDLEMRRLDGIRRHASPPVDTRWFTWPRGRHSEKPAAFLDLVEQVSPAPRLELFARRQRLGWDTWGNEALEHVEMSA